VIVGVVKETAPGERRVALVPDGVQALARAGLEVRVEAGAGEAAGFADAAYRAAGAGIAPAAAAVRGEADVLLRVALADAADADGLRRGAALVALLRPLEAPQVAAGLAQRGVSALALELVPRITRAQSMDVLSSQATVAGYRAVLLAATRLTKMFPMLVTAAGTISPARVFVIGAGVAGLQAIATARRLGALVEAYDLREAAAEQVESLGARFVRLALEAGDAEDAGGYARAQSEAFYAKQRQLMAERAAASDVVITTALVPGRRAPLLLDDAGVQGMRAGSVVVDLAAPNGGNCAATRPDAETRVGGVLVLGPTNLASDLPTDASRMFSRNVVTLLQHLVRDGALSLDPADEIVHCTLVAHGGEVVQEAVRQRLAGTGGG
jgi:NAD(P) transhydrogenase subunit alpha